jgi:hypothetical protein
MRSKFKWIYTLLIVLSIQLVSAQEKTVTGVVSDDSGTLPGNVVVRGTRAVLKQILMENTLLKQNRRCSSILFCWYG